MSDTASGAANPRAFDPTRHNFYAISENTQLELRTLFEAMTSLALLIEPQPDEHRPCPIDASQLAPIFFTFGAHGARLVEEMQIHNLAVNKRKTS